VRDVEGRVDLADAEELDDVGILELGANFTWSIRLFTVSAFAERFGPHAQDGDDLLEAGGAELGGAILRAETGGLDLFEEHELPELLFLGHGGRP
jgi:hypothetical protein